MYNTYKNPMFCGSFEGDWEKMYDFWRLTKKEFLESYSYLTEIEYDSTCAITIGYIPDNDSIPIRRADTVIAVIKNKDIHIRDIAKSEQCLIDNGIDEDEADTVLQALGYTLLGVELYPER